MSFFKAPNNTQIVMDAIGKREQNGEVVIKVIISPNLHMALIEEAWMYDYEIIEEVRSISMIPVETSFDFRKKHFEIVTEKGQYRNDA